MGTPAAGKGMETDINVTPMIDVLLVLLIIFIMALPTMRKAIDVQLPDPSPPVLLRHGSPDQIVLEVNPGGDYAINSVAVAHDALGTRLHAIYDGRPDKVLFVKGSPESTYGDVTNAMDVARGSGILVIGVPPKDIGTSK